MTRKRPVPRYRIGRSKTGLGLFATAPIRKGSFIIEYKGRRITNKECERLESKGSRYMYELDDKWTVDGSPRSNTARYANHNCRPNAESDVVKRKIIIRAIKKIKEGAEITYDYGKDYFAAYLTKRGCKCTTCVNRRARERADYRLRTERRKKREATAAKKKRAAKSTTSKMGIGKAAPAKAAPAKAAKSRRVAGKSPAGRRPAAKRPTAKRATGGTSRKTRASA